MRKVIIILVFFIFVLLTGCTEETGIYYEDKIAVLMYHHIDEEESGATITPERFKEHLNTLKTKGYNVISIDVLRDFLNGETEVPANAVLLTFDDGYESFYNYAYPILKEVDMTATVFMIVKHIDVKEGQIPKLSWDQMQEMLEDGMSFYSHTYDSHYYHVTNAKGSEDAALASRMYLKDEDRQETEEEYLARIYDDLKKSKDELEQQLNIEVDFLSVPYGRKNQKVEQVSKEIGLDYIFTIKPGYVDKQTSPMALPRFNAGSPEIDGEKLHEIISGAATNNGIKNIMSKIYLKIKN